MKSVKCRISILAVTLLIAVSATAQRGAITLPRNLAQITDQAANVIRGKVTYVHVEPHPQYKHLRSVVVTVAVSKTLKGSATDTVTFRQFLWDPRDVRDAAGYRRGQEVVLFLNRASEIGFTSPVGIQQGRFTVQTDENGVLVAKNGQDNATLLKDVPQLSSTKALSARARRVITEGEKTGGAIPVDVLEETVRSLVAVQGSNQ